jgi:hypothetical protein
VSDASGCSRRAFLAGIGSTTTATLAAGSSSAADVVADRSEEGREGTGFSDETRLIGDSEPGRGSGRRRQRVRPRFDVTLDAVSDLGCDPTGAQPCDRALEAGLAAIESSRVQVRFPPGTYRLESRQRFAGYDAFGLVGSGTGEGEGKEESEAETRFVCPAGYQREWFRIERVGAFVFSGIDWDIRAPSCGPAVVARADRSLLIEDVEVLGRGAGDENLLMPRVGSPDGVGVIRRFVARDGGVLGRRRIGVWVGPENGGVLRFEACQLEEFPNNGIYASASKGAIEVLGGTYRNSDISQLRLSGPGCLVRGTLVAVDTREYDGPRSAGKYRNPRGIWWEAKRRRATGGRIEYTTVSVRRGPSVGAVVIAKNGGAITVSRTAIEADAADTHGIFAYEPTGGHYEVPPRPWRVRLNYVHVYGASSAPSIEIEGRPASNVTNSCIANGVLVADRPAEDTVDRLRNLARDGRQLVGARTGCFDHAIGAGAAPSIPRARARPGIQGDRTTPLTPIAIRTLLLVGMVGLGAVLSLGLCIAVGSTLRSLLESLR